MLSTTHKTIFIIFLAAFLASCGNDKSPNKPNVELEITAVSPTSGPPGIEVTISGSGFSPTASEDTVTFDDSVAAVNSASEDTLEAIVPQDATTGPVQVTVGGETTTGPTFTVEAKAPAIEAIDPDSGTVGTEVIITGMNFGDVVEENQVTFNGTAAPVATASDTQLVAEVPEGAETGPVEVIVEAKSAQGPIFTVVIPKPAIEAVEPDSGKFGTEVTITGENFGVAPGANQITFNGTEASVISASETELVAEVPEGAETGPVEVTVDGETAEGPEFTYIPTVTVSTYAGTGSGGFSNGDRLEAEFNFPEGLALKDDGTLYVADSDNHLIREITPAGQVSTLAGGEGTPGFEDGTGTEARFNGPCGLALDEQGNLFVGDRFNNSIRKVTAAGAVTTFAGDTTSGFSDGVGTEARFDKPCGVAIDENQNLFVAEKFNHSIRKITSAAVVETYAGTGKPGYKDGPPIIAQFRRPEGPAITSDGDLLIADGNNDVVRIIPPGGEVGTLAGDGAEGDRDGPVEEARFNSPYGITVGKDGTIYIAENSNHTIRRIKDGRVTTLAGTGESGFTDGPGEEAQFQNPNGVVIDDEGNLFVADQGNNRIRKIVIE